MAFSDAFDHAMQALLGDGLERVAARLSRYGAEYRRNPRLPDAVADPDDREQFRALVRACSEHRVPLVARGAGTNTTGAPVLAAGSVVVSFERMDRILAIRPGDRCAVFEPDVVNGVLHETLRAHGRFWPPAPTSADTRTVGRN